MKRKADKRYWLCGLAALCCVGGIFAYWTQELPVHNEFQTAAYDTGIEERFSSPDDWKPGQETNKDVWITNRGTVPVFVKAVLHQEWIRKASSIPLTFQTTDGNAYAAQIIWGENVVLLKTGKKSDIDLGLDTVDRVEDAGGKWLLASDLPDQNGDYLLYYIGVIDPNENSPLIVDAVTMNASIQPEIVRKDTCYDKEREEWVTTQEYNLAENYENARYHLLVTATTVQATPDAAKDIFGKLPGNIKGATNDGARKT